MENKLRVTNDSFKSPVIGTDSVTKGTFKITHARIVFVYDEDEDKIKKDTRAKGDVVIDGYNNPLYDALKEHPLRIQGLVASVVFGTEKKFIRIHRVLDFDIVDDGLIKEIELMLIFDILDNLEFLEKVIEYKDDHKL